MDSKNTGPSDVAAPQQKLVRAVARGAELLGVSRNVIRQAIKRGALPVSIINGIAYTTESAIVALADLRPRS